MLAKSLSGQFSLNVAWVCIRTVRPRVTWWQPMWTLSVSLNTVGAVYHLSEYLFSLKSIFSPKPIQCALWLS